MNFVSNSFIVNVILVLIKKLSFKKKLNKKTEH